MYRLDKNIKIHETMKIKDNDMTTGQRQVILQRFLSCEHEMNNRPKSNPSSTLWEGQTGHRRGLLGPGAVHCGFIFKMQGLQVDTECKTKTQDV